MKVTIIGTGNMARGIGSRLVAGGHAVTIAGRNLTKAQALAERLEVRGGFRSLGAEIDDPVVFLAVHYSALGEVLASCGPRLDGRILVDVINPVSATYDSLMPIAAGSVAQEIARELPHARVVKSFNTTFHDALLIGTAEEVPLDVFLAGDDMPAKATVAELARTSGMRPIDIGPLARARELEAAALVHILAQGRLGTDFTSALQICSTAARYTDSYGDSDGPDKI